MESRYFKLNEEVFLVTGNRAAIYNVLNKSIFLLSDEEEKIISDFELGGLVDTEYKKNIANEIKKLGLGNYYNTNIYIEKINTMPKWYEYLFFKPAPIINRITIQLEDCQYYCENCDVKRYRRYCNCFVNEITNNRKRLDYDKYRNLIDQIKLLDVREVLFTGSGYNNRFNAKEELIEKCIEVGIKNIKYIQCYKDLHNINYIKLSNIGAFMILQTDNNIDIDLLKQLKNLNIKFMLLIILKFKEEKIHRKSELEDLKIKYNIDYVFNVEEDKNEIMDLYNGEINGVGLEAFSQNLKYNRCLNGNIAVNNSGIISPCLGLKEESVGNINSFFDIFKNNKLSKYWELSIDKIDKCKDCGLRYACFDCRSLEIKLGARLFGKISCMR